MTLTKTHLTAAAAIAAAGASAHAQSAWLPEAGELVVSPAFSFSTFDEFWVGGMLVNPLEANGEHLEQYTPYLSLEYGVLDRLAADLSVGYTWTSDTTTFGDGDEGWADVLFGLSYRLVDETDTLPVVAVRAGGTVAGTYDENAPFSAGDGADAVEGSLMFGKTFGASGFGAYGDIGYRFRDDPAPEEWFGSLGVFKQIPDVFASGDAITVSTGYRHIESVDGLDIGGPGFDPSRGSAHGFPALEEVVQLFEIALGYADVAGRQYQATVARSVDGRNTGDKLILGFGVTLPF